MTFKSKHIMINIHCVKKCDTAQISLIYMYEHGRHKKTSYGVLKAVWVRVEKKNTVLPLNIPQYVIMNVNSLPCVCDRSGPLSLSLGIPSHAHSAAHARICVKP